jgi:hypothetical protein
VRGARDAPKLNLFTELFFAFGNEEETPGLAEEQYNFLQIAVLEIKVE